MRDGWVETSLGEVAEWWSGGTPKAREPKYYANGTIPWAVIADMNKGTIASTNSYITEEALAAIGGRLAPVDSVLISMYASVGKSAVASIPLATNQAIAWSIPNEDKIIPFFLYLVAQKLEKPIFDSARGATQRNINRQMLREFNFLLPPLPEQKRIVDLISSVDSYIEALQQQLASAKTARNAVLHELLTAGGDGWVETTFGEVFKIVAGKYVAKQEYVDDGKFWIYGSNSIMGKLDKYLVEQSHVVMAAIGAYAGAVRYSKDPSWINNNAMALVPTKGVMAEYLHLWLESKFDLKRVVVGTGQPYVQRPLLLKEFIVIPPLPEQKRIVDIVSAFDGVIDSVEVTATEAQKVRSGLLSDLLSGNHEIPSSYDKSMGAA
jgi:restriction endonuclease S subunit